MGKDKIVDLLRKLIAKEQSTREIGNLEEAEAFAAKIGELLQKHKIDMTDVELAALDEADPMGEAWFSPKEHGVRERKARVAWLEQLAAVVARAHFCRILVVRGSNRVVFIGRDSDRAVAAAMYGILARTGEKLSARDYNTFFQKMKRHGTPEKARGFMNSWLNGYVNAINARYKALRAEVKTDRGMALVKIADAAVEDYVKKVSGGPVKSAKSVATQANAQGYNKGLAAGQGVGLQGGITAGTAATAQRLFKQAYEGLTLEQKLTVLRDLRLQAVGTPEYEAVFKDSRDKGALLAYGRGWDALTSSEQEDVARLIDGGKALAGAK